MDEYGKEKEKKQQFSYLKNLRILELETKITYKFSSLKSAEFWTCGSDGPLVIHLPFDHLEEQRWLITILHQHLLPVISVHDRFMG